MSWQEGVLSLFLRSQAHFLQVWGPLWPRVSGVFSAALRVQTSFEANEAALGLRSGPPEYKLLAGRAGCTLVRVTWKAFEGALRASFFWGRFSLGGAGGGREKTRGLLKWAILFHVVFPLFCCIYIYIYIYVYIIIIIIIITITSGGRGAKNSVLFVQRCKVFVDLHVCAAERPVVELKKLLQAYDVSLFCFNGKRIIELHVGGGLKRHPNLNLG